MVGGQKYKYMDALAKHGVFNPDKWAIKAIITKPAVATINNRIVTSQKVGDGPVTTIAVNRH